jgi:EAL domain-containing protein (putative c-di-GMP-specific phosphodiesterase class I)/GGDEF domain-containing protein
MGAGTDDAREFALVTAAGAGDFLAAEEPLELAVERVRAALVRHAVRGLAQRSPAAGQMVSADEICSMLRAAAERSRRSANALGVLCFDLDPVRQLMGSLPVAQAEAWLVRLGERLRSACRSDDRLARLRSARASDSVSRTSRGEFVLVLEGRFDEARLLALARRLAAVVREPLDVGGHTLAASCYVGAALWSADAPAEELLEHARAAAFAARRAGLGASVFFDADLKERAVARAELESALRGALERGEFELHYQPRMCVATGRTLGFEALLRWRLPGRGLVSPAEFIPIAEETGLIVPLGRWVLGEACAQAKRWQAQGFEPTHMAVNLSPLQFRDPRLFADVESALRRSQLDPRWLELELTESSLMHDVDAVSAALQRFKALGITISIDDFGTGYSSLAYLRRLPIDALKIDRSFLREVTREPDDASIATAIVLLAKCLRLRVVAEGVETPGQLAFLRIMKCDEAQGYLFARPAPANECERWLTRAGEATDERAAAA